MRAWLFIGGLGLCVGAAGCSGGGGKAGDDGMDGGGGANDPFAHDDSTLTSITVDPPNAAITILNDKIVTQDFKAIAHFSDAKTKELAADVAWFATNPQIGKMTGGGTYTPSGALGGAVTVRAEYMKMKATASVAVKLKYERNSAMLGQNEQTALRNASTPDGSVVWAYPYDGTVFPRGLGGPTMQWFGGGATDAYRVHVESAAYELEDFVKVPPPARYPWAQTDWTKFTDSSSGAAKLDVARWNGSQATVVAKHAWTIAPASMRGTIYYWSNNLGRILRIKPGAAQPDDFLGAAGVNGCSTCHAVSANGSTLVIGGDVSTSTFDLKGNKPVLSGIGRAWAMPALSPDGTFLVENASPLPGPPGGSDGLFYTASAQRVSGSGLDGHRMGMPAFAPDGSLLAYRDEAGGPTPGSLRLWDFDPKMGKAKNDREIIKPGNNASLATIAFPSVSPDAKWVVYARGNTLDTRGGTDDLYLASTTQQNVEVRLGKVDGDGYPFAMGARDLSWNFEPTFAPVAAGGYFWVVFTSRRTYGNTLVGDKSATKQLWVAAIDQNPQPNQDPSHAAFHLPGQDENNMAMRGFWALDPCKGDGQGCSSGTECCGGYCDGSGDGGAMVCSPVSNGCSADGDKCVTTQDCCNAGSGVQCINHVCSEPTPK